MDLSRPIDRINTVYKVYAASHFPNRAMLRLILPELEKKFSIQFVNTWVYKEETHSFPTEIKRDFDEIDEADFMMVFYPWGHGARCETTYAMGAKKPVVVYIDGLTLPGLSSIEQGSYSEFFPLAKFIYYQENSMYHEHTKYPWIMATTPEKLHGAIRQAINILDCK